MTPEKRLVPDAAYAGDETSQSRNYADSIAGDRRQHFDPLAANGRRHAYSRRTPPVWPCGCIRDPDRDRHRCSVEVSDNMAEAAVAAITHLDELGTPGLLNTATCQAMWRVGRHKLAAEVHRRTAGTA